MVSTFFPHVRCAWSMPLQSYPSGNHEEYFSDSWEHGAAQRLCGSVSI